YGAGEVRPGLAYNPGLVYDSDIIDWAAYACAIDQWELAFSAPTCAELPDIDASDLNYPSIAIGDLAGTQTVTRTVTDVTGEAAPTPSTSRPPRAQMSRCRRRSSRSRRVAR